MAEEGGNDRTKPFIKTVSPAGSPTGSVSDGSSEDGDRENGGKNTTAAAIAASEQDSGSNRSQSVPPKENTKPLDDEAPPSTTLAPTTTGVTPESLGSQGGQQQPSNGEGHVVVEQRGDGPTMPNVHFSAEEQAAESGNAAQAVFESKRSANQERVIPFDEWKRVIPQEQLLNHAFSCTKKMSKGKHRDVEVEVLIHPEITDTATRRGRATVSVKTRKLPSHVYKASASITLFDPENEVILVESSVENKVAFRTNEVAFDVGLGEGLKEKIEKSSSKELELHVKVKLFHEPTKIVMREVLSFLVIDKVPC